MRIRKFFVVLLSLSLLLPIPAFALDQSDMLQKIEVLSKELERMKQQLQDMQKKDADKEERITVVEKKSQDSKDSSSQSWLQLGGDYRFRGDYLTGKVANHYHFGTMQRDVQSRIANGTMGAMRTGAGAPWYEPGLAVYGAAMASGQTTGYIAKNDSILMNRFGLNMVAKATEDVQVKARLLMYKTWGNNTIDQSPFFADRYVLMDGNLGHVPTDNTLRVDQAYATWSNIGGAPVWFSIGRRPSTGGIPTNIRQNLEKSGTAGVPGLLVDYAFDGFTLGVAPDIDFLPGAYAKFCYGKGMDSGFYEQGNYTNRFKDVQFYGLNIVPYDTDNLHVELQWQKGKDIFAFPGSSDPFGLGATNKNIGDLTWYGSVVSGKIDKLGFGDLNLFGSFAVSTTDPNDNMYSGNFYNDNGTGTGGIAYFQNTALAGFLYDPDARGGSTLKQSRTGSAYYLGARYDIKPTLTKIGVEYNRGSKYWMAFTPAADDTWTGKLGTRGSVYEVYVIQELNKKPIAKRGKAFARLGYQKYNFEYTGSGFWLGEPKKISELTTNSNSLLRPVQSADNIYLTLDVMF